MNEEQLIQFLKDKLEIRVQAGDRLVGGAGGYMAKDLTVSIYLNGEEITSATETISTTD